MANLADNGVNGAASNPEEAKPVLVFLAGASGAGKTTFYESKLHNGLPTMLRTSASPLEQSQVDEQCNRLLKDRQSFVYVDSIVDQEMLRRGRSHGMETRVIFIGTEHPDLNTARVLGRVSRGGPFAPLAAISDEYEKGLAELPAVRKAADELILLDNTAEGRGHRVVAQFEKGEILKLARSIPEWAQKAFGKEFTKWLAQERRVHERGR